MGVARLRRHRSASYRVAGSGRSKPPMAAWTVSATGSACSTPCGSGSGGETCSRHPACALPTRGSAFWRVQPGRQRGRPSAAPWASQPMDRPRLREWPSAWTPPIRIPRRTYPRTPPCRLTAASWCCPLSTSWRSRPAWSRSRRPWPHACPWWICPSCCSKCTLALALPTGSPMPARAAHGPAVSPPVYARCCWPRRATPGSSRSSGATMRRCGAHG